MHPRPTLTRPGWVSLDGLWQFTVGEAGDDPFALEYEQEILVPFPPESAASGIGVDTCEHPRYRRRFTATPAQGNRLLLHFEAVDHQALVWVNGRFVGEHVGGYVPFTLDITDALAFGKDGEHELTVAAFDDAKSIEIPRGKQAWTPQPNVIWYRRSSGIWRTVWLEEVPGTSIAEVSWKALDTFGSVLGSITLAGWRPGLTVEATFLHEGVLLARVAVEAVGPRADLAAGLASSRTKLPEELLWSPGRPNLIDIKLRLLDGMTTVDAAASYTGLRVLGLADGKVTVNGAPVFQRLVLEQGYWPDTEFTAPSQAALRAEAELIARLGFNGLRMHQVTADPRFLRMCDEVGLMVWADLPAAYQFSEAALAQTTANLFALIARDRNHPSVVAWVPFNESWGLENLPGSAAQRQAVVALHALAKALDPSRIALGNDGWEHVAGDLVGIHDYSHEPEQLQRKYGCEGISATLAAPKGSSGHAAVLSDAGAAVGDAWVLLSEFGGVSFNGCGEAWSGYGAVGSAHALVERVASLVKVVGPDSGLAGFCWTQLTDTLQEQNGLAWPDRTPKADPELLREALSG